MRGLAGPPGQICTFAVNNSRPTDTNSETFLIYLTLQTKKIHGYWLKKESSGQAFYRSVICSQLETAVSFSEFLVDDKSSALMFCFHSSEKVRLQTRSGRDSGSEWVTGERWRHMKPRRRLASHGPAARETSGGAQDPVTLQRPAGEFTATNKPQISSYPGNSGTHRREPGRPEASHMRRIHPQQQTVFCDPKHCWPFRACLPRPGEVQPAAGNKLSGFSLFLL